MFVHIAWSSKPTFVLFSDPKIEKVETGKNLVRVQVFPEQCFAVDIDNTMTKLQQWTAEGSTTSHQIMK